MSEKLKVTSGSGNVFLDLGFEKAEAENLMLRTELKAWMRSSKSPAAPA
jgi:hypothetical protein